jgi:hypothetical protein
MITNPRLKRHILFQDGKTILPNEKETEVSKEMSDDVGQKKLKLKLIPPKSKDENLGGTIEERTDSLYKWLSTHNLINLNKLCETCGIDRANFVKGVASDKAVKQETIEKFESILKPYGYGK